MEQKERLLEVENLSIVFPSKIGKQIVEKKALDGVSAYIVLIISICFGIVLLALLTKLGIALIVFAAAVMIIFTLLKNVIFGIFIVELVKTRYAKQEIKPNGVLTAIVVFLILELLEIIPYVGEIIKFIVFIFSLGIVYSLIKKDNEKVEVVKEDKQEVIDVK